MTAALRDSLSTSVRSTLLYALILSVTGCAPLGSAVQYVLDPDARLAHRITIVRDTWGIPHIYGPTDASVVFGLAYAQAEDDFWQIEDAYIRGLGRAAEVYGARALADDVVRRAFQVTRRARAEYQREPPGRRALWDAYAAGLNYFLKRHGGIRPRLLKHFEPWYPFTLVRSVSARTVVAGVQLGDSAAVVRAASGKEWRPIGRWLGAPAGADQAASAAAVSSRGWALAPARSATGHALLLQVRGAPYFGVGQGGEVSLASDVGWHFSGWAELGAPIPSAGHNDVLGWSLTPARRAVAATYVEAFDNPGDPLAYRYNGTWREAVEWTDSVRVRTAAGTMVRHLRFRRTQHGPVIALRDGKALAVQVAGMDAGGAYQQLYAMGRAGNLTEFRQALATGGLPGQSTVYADRAGNIMFVQGGVAPGRAAGVDWTAPVDGTDPATEWRGSFRLEALPQVVNPAQGWVQSDGPVTVSATNTGAQPGGQGIPRAVPPAGRAQRVRRLLAGTERWTPDALVGLAFDTHVAAADRELPRLVDEWERLGARDPARAARLDSTIAELRRWDRRATSDAPAATVFLLWLQRRQQAPGDGAPWARLQALEKVVAALQEEYGTAHVPWGDVHRLQRIDTFGWSGFSGDSLSLPLPGAAPSAETLLTLRSRTGPGGVTRYGVGGTSWVSVTEFGAAARGSAITHFGQSADPRSPHFFDQAWWFVRGTLRSAWYEPEQVRRHAERSYHPGGGRADF